MTLSIRKRLIIAFISLAVAPLLLVGGILGWHNYKTMKDFTLSLQGQMGQGVLNTLTSFFEQVEGDLRLAGRLTSLQTEDEDVRYDILKLLMSKEVFEKIILLDQQGQTKLYLSRLGLSSAGAVNYAEDEGFISAKTDNVTYYSPVRFESSTGEPYMTIAIPILNVRTGIIDGVLLAEVRIKKIWDLIAGMPTNPGQIIYILDSQGKVIAHRNPSVVLRGTYFNIPERDGIQPGLTGDNTVLTIHRGSFGEQEFNIVTEQGVSQAFAPAIYSVRITVALVVIALIAAFILGFLIVRMIIRPVHNMAVTAEAISTGDLSQKVEVVRNDEIGLLGRAFNSMTTQLKNLIDNLEQKIAERTRQLKDAQTELLNQERLTALGKVTATIAHEIRNPLATVNTSIFSIGAAMEKNETARIKRALNLAERNIKRCDNIITELLDYTKKLEIRRTKTNIDMWMNGILDEQSFPDGIECGRTLSSGLVVPIDSEHMRRAVINVITNAVHALSDENSSGNELVVETTGTDNILEIRISDNGPGITDEVQARLFEPLFSTKDFGVGLGLSITKDIMGKHNGGIRIESNVGEGTTVILWVPIEER